MEKITQINVTNAYVKNMQTYAVALNRKQATAEVRDGLKSVARRIIDIMYEKNNTHDKPYSKCAKVVGDVIGTRHPHGDSSVYGVMVAIANWYDCKVPLIDGHGNFGNMQGADAAAYRYTECRLSAFADDCVVGGLSKDIVDWVPNFNSSEMEPEYLPVKIPLLLINGTFGIGIGMKAEIPTHNLSEVVKATINLIKNPNAPVVLVPDHCMGCDIVDTNWKAISNTGAGTYRVRAVIDIEYTKGDCPLLVIKSIPNNVTLFQAKGVSGDRGEIAKINKMVKEGVLPQITNIYTDSKGDSLRYVIQLKKGSDPVYVKDYLYKHTLLENSYRVNFEVLNIIEPLRCSYKSYLEFFIEFSITLKIRMYAAKHQKDKTEWVQYQLYIKVMESGEIEALQKKIREMKKVTTESRAEFKEWIIKKFKVTDLEAGFIMSMDMMKTAIGYLPIYKERCNKLEASFQECFIKMNDENIIKQEIIDELTLFDKKYGEPRKCRIVSDTSDSIPKGTFKVVVTDSNFIKKIDVNENATSYRGDNPKFIIKAENTESILLFDNMGKVFKVPVHTIAMCDKTSQGFDLRLLIKNCTSDIISVMYEPSVVELSKKNKKHFITVVTRMNCIKKMDLDDFVNVLPSGIIYTKLNNGDFVKDICIAPNAVDVVVYSDKKALRFNLDDIPHYKRTALGVTAMGTPNPIDGICIINSAATDCIVITESGYINRFSLMGLKTSKRNNAGSNVIKLSATDRIHSIYSVNESDTIEIVTKTGMTSIRVVDIKQSSSAGKGERAIKGDKIIKTKIV